MQAITGQNDTSTLERVLISRCAFLLGRPDSFGQAVQASIDWMQTFLPEAADLAKAGPAADISGRAGRVQAVRLDTPDGQLWSARLTLPVPASPDHGTQGQITNEIYLAQSDRGPLARRCFFGIRRHGPAGVAEQPRRAKLVPTLIERFGAEADGHRLMGSWQNVIDQPAYDALIALLEDANRLLPVLVMARSWSAEAVDADAAAARLCGAAHLIRLELPWPGRLADLYGAEFAVPLGGVRLFSPPGEASDRFPLWRLDSTSPITAQQRQNLEELAAAAFALGLDVPPDEDFPAFETLLQRQPIARQSAKPAAAATPKSTPIPPAEPVAAPAPMLAEAVAPYLAAEPQQTSALIQEELAAQKAEYDALLDLAEAERAAALAAEAAAREEIARLRSRIAWLEQSAIDRGTQPVSQPLTSFAEFDAWADRELAGRVWIAPKARRALRDAEFENPAIIGDALLALRDLFIPMKRTGGIKLKRAFDDRLAELRIQDQPCFAQRDSIKAYPEYQVTYEGEPLWCHTHLKYGKGYDPRHMFRIYYAWHESSGQVIIGHMPTHLDNKATS